MLSPTIHSSSGPHALPIRRDTGIHWTLLPYLVVQLVVRSLKLSIHGKNKWYQLYRCEVKISITFLLRCRGNKHRKGGEKEKKRNQICVYTGSKLAQLPQLRSFPSKSVKRCASPKHLALLAFMLTRQISTRVWMNVSDTLNGSTKWQISSKLYCGLHR
jgi:hypothetical protein